MKRILLILICVIMLSSCGASKKHDKKVAGNCSIIISCEDILKNIDSVNEAVKEFVPEDGIILSAENVEFFENETAFDLLMRICKEKKIKMQFEKNPALDSKYVTEINNIKTRDGGEMSGWTYYVNNEFSIKAADKYVLNNKDIIKWCYICDMSAEFSE